MTGFIAGMPFLGDLDENISEMNKPDNRKQF